MGGEMSIYGMNVCSDVDSFADYVKYMESSEESITRIIKDYVKVTE